jgi:hypothetical protein
LQLKVTMRELNTKEQQLINEIIQKDSFYFRDWFSDNLINNTSIKVYFKNKDVVLFYDPNNIQIRDVFKELTLIIGLVRLLEKNDLLLRIQVEVEMEPAITIGKLIDGREFEFGDQNLKNELAINILTEFFITEELKFFVNNNFRTRETRRHRQTMAVSWTAIGIALLSSWYAFIFPDKGYKEDFQTLDNEIKMTNKSLDSIKYELKEIRLRATKDLDTTKIK